MNKADDLPMAMMSDHVSCGTNGKMGKLLLAKRLISKEQLQEALLLQQRWGTRLGDILLAKGWVRALDFYHTLADHLGKKYVDLFSEPPDGQLLSNDDLSHYTELLVLPWRVVNGRVIVALADPSEAALAYIRERYGTSSGWCSAMPTVISTRWRALHCRSETRSTQPRRSFL
jgi:hypothetical protein